MSLRFFNRGFGGDVGDPMSAIFPSGRTYSYQLETGNVVQLPIEWDHVGDDSKLRWIQQSNLLPSDAVQLEDESFVDEESNENNYDASNTLSTSSGKKPAANYLMLGLVALLGILLVASGSRR